jgi:hypothetical protein
MESSAMPIAVSTAALSVLLTIGNLAIAQQVHTGTGNMNGGDSFNEFVGSHWGMHGQGWFFNFGGGAPGGGAGVPFGGVPGGLSGGFGFGGGGVGGGFGFTAGQGYSSSVGSTTGSLTTMNGAPGFLFNGTLTPFVTQIIPVVSGPPPVVFQSPLAAKLQMAGGVQGLRPPLRRPGSEDDEARPAAEQERTTQRSSNNGLGSTRSSAERGDLSVVAIRRQQAAEDAALQAELDRFIAEADRLEAAGDARAAAHQYSKAAAKVEGAKRQEFLDKARALRAK